MSERPFLISGSVLSADLSALAQEAKVFAEAGGDWIHIDVMDGRFVPNLTVGIPVVAALAKRCNLPLDVHLMIVEPERYTDEFAKAGAAVITVQAEACLHLYRTLQHVRASGALAGVALNPATPLSAIEHVLDIVDLVLVMTVEPGFGGQQFLPAMLPKVKALAEKIKGNQLAVDIEVDGGINKETIGLVAKAGANVFVSGSWVFGGGDVGLAVRELRKVLS